MPAEQRWARAEVLMSALGMSGRGVPPTLFFQTGVPLPDVPMRNSALIITKVANQDCSQ